jgi:hypothetical protein
VADNRYVDIDYVANGYDEVQNTAWYIESDYFTTGYVIQGTTQSGEAAISAASVVSATSERTRTGSLTCQSTATFAASAVKVFGADTALTATATFTATALQLVAAELTAFNSISLTATAGKIHGAVGTINTNSTLAATALKIQPGAADFTAFNTVVVAAGRIRPAADISALSATLTATAVKVFGASTNTIEYYNSHQFGEAGFRPQSGTNVGIGYLNYRAIVGDDNTLSGGFDGTTFSFYARADVGGTSGTIAYITTDRGPIRIRLITGGEGVSDSLQFVFSWNLDAIINTPIYNFTTTRLHHYYIHIGAWNWPQANTADRVRVVDAWVDGIHLGQQFAYTGDTSNPYYMNPDLLYIGSDSAGNDRWQGTLAQFWVSGYNSLNSNYLQLLTPTAYESFGANGTKGGQLNNGFGTTGPLYFIEGGRYNDGYPLEAGDLLTSNPLDTAYPIQGNFAIIANGFSITYGEASLQSTASLSARLGYKKSVAATMSSAFGFTATPYGFTKAEAAMQSAFAFTADPDEISGGVSLTLATVSLVADADVIRSGVVVATLFTDIAVTATTNQLGYAVLIAQATLSATPYNFTKVSAVINASALLQGEGRLQARVRGNVQMQSAFSLTAQTLRIRTTGLQMSAQASVLTGIGNALRSGSITMLAFDTVLSAGKIIEFLIENTIIVTEEQRRLRVALESTVLLVQMANGVNTITAETTDIVVPQEQGRLLAQHNLPTN